MELIKVTTECIQLTRTEWGNQVEAHVGNISVGRYERLIDWAEKYPNGNLDKNTHAYAVVSKGSVGPALSLVELSHALPNSPDGWLKMLSIYMQPSLDVAIEDGSQSDRLETIAEIAATAIVESLALTFVEHPTKELKVFGGTTPLTLDFLEGMATGLKKLLGQPIHVSTHGQWLVIRKE